ncbi:hypothetical protein DHD32_12755 [Arenibacter sp. TNZ]|nr:hypothetical protein [Arenibacter sp. TNZ]
MVCFKHLQAIKIGTRKHLFLCENTGSIFCYLFFEKLFHIVFNKQIPEMVTPLFKSVYVIPKTFGIILLLKDRDTQESRSFRGVPLDLLKSLFY